MRFTLHIAHERMHRVVCRLSSNVLCMSTCHKQRSASPKNDDFPYCHHYDNMSRILFSTRVCNTFAWDFSLIFTADCARLSHVDNSLSTKFSPLTVAIERARQIEFQNFIGHRVEHGNVISLQNFAIKLFRVSLLCAHAHTVQQSAHCICQLNSCAMCMHMCLLRVESYINKNCESLCLCLYESQLKWREITDFLHFKQNTPQYLGQSTAGCRCTIANDIQTQKSIKIWMISFLFSFH